MRQFPGSVIEAPVARDPFGLFEPVAGPITLADFHIRSVPSPGEQINAAAFVPDLDYEMQEGVREALDAVRSAAPLVFISGRAGTGKSRLINYMRDMPGGEKQVVVAPTGVAALALKAATIHSFFRLPLGVIDAAQMEDDQRFGSVPRRMRRLVIDEISMVRADIVDAIDHRLRLLRDPSRPFGGVQVVMVGDFLQLPPVVTDEDRALLERLGYPTPFAFSARIMQNTPIRVATLKKVWRQSDPELIEALGCIREGRRVEGAVEWLNTHCAGPHRACAPPLLLTATRASAEQYNAEGLENLRASHGGRDGEHITFTARASGSYEPDWAILPVPRRLELFRGSRVMAVRNDPAGNYVNGSLGEVTDFHDAGGEYGNAWVEVLFDGAPRPVRLPPVEWTSSTQAWDEEEDAIVETVTGSYQQIPLVFGWAITIHKSQGLSLDNVRIDLGRGAFAPGQLYVALSRARSIEGLSLARPIRVADVKVDEMLVAFIDWTRAAENLEFPSATT